MSLETQALYGFLKGYSPLVGYNYGAKNAERVEEATKTAILWSTAVNILFGIICIVFAKQGGMLSFFRQGLFLIPFLLIFSSAFGVMGMIFAQLIADICAAALTLIMWRKERVLQRA